LSPFFNLFTAHITGAAALTHGIGAGGLVKLLMIPIFVLVVALAKLFLRATRRQGALSVASLLASMTILMDGFGATSFWFQPKLTDINNWQVIFVGVLGVAAKGIQKGLRRGALRGFSVTTMKPHPVHTIDLVERLFPPRSCMPGSVASMPSGPAGTCENRFSRSSASWSAPRREPSG